MAQSSLSTISLTLLLSITLLISSLVQARNNISPLAQREHLTPEEIELVRDAQELDRRTTVFIKAIERRLVALAGPAPPTSEKERKKKEKEKERDAELWGELPQKTRAEYLYDIARILDEAITNIDDSSERNPKSPLLQKSLRLLVDAAKDFLPRLTALRRSSISKEAESEALEKAIANTEEIISAASKIQPEEKKK